MPLDDDDPVEIYRREIATVSPLTMDEEAHLFQEATQSGERGEVAKRRLIESYLHLVLPIAERHASSGRLSILELIQEGNLGLMRALEKFPETHLDDFSAYASSCIEDFISDAVARSKSH
ncbi:MAG TPA: sigma-70 family RNA polymerase sigma factor [Terriglobales bacterium]|nr:sigma-70 family RNA polymerase sigma factor [Terriglobales bacterium]